MLEWKTNARSLDEEDALRVAKYLELRSEIEEKQVELEALKKDMVTFAIREDGEEFEFEGAKIQIQRRKTFDNTLLNRALKNKMEVTVNGQTIMASVDDLKESASAYQKAVKSTTPEAIAGHKAVLVVKMPKL